jgi:hypothetical protein
MNGLLTFLANKCDSALLVADCGTNFAREMARRI